MTILRLGSPEVNVLMNRGNTPEEDISINLPVDPNYQDNSELFLGRTYEMTHSEGFNGRRIDPKMPIGIKIIKK